MNVQGGGLGPPEIAGLAAEGLLATRARGIADSAATEEAAAREMEGLFMTVLVKELRKTIPGDGLFGKGPGSDVFEGWFDTALGEALVQGPGTALRDAIRLSLQGPKAEENVAPQTNHQAAPLDTDHPEVSRNPTIAGSGPAAENQE